MTLSLCLTGLAAVVYGAWLIYHPAGFIAFGILLFLVSLIADKESKR